MTSAVVSEWERAAGSELGEFYTHAPTSPPSPPKCALDPFHIYRDIHYCANPLNQAPPRQYIWKRANIKYYYGMKILGCVVTM